MSRDTTPRYAYCGALPPGVRRYDPASAPLNRMCQNCARAIERRGSVEVSWLVEWTRFLADQQQRRHAAMLARVAELDHRTLSGAPVAVAHGDAVARHVAAIDDLCADLTDWDDICDVHDEYIHALEGAGLAAQLIGLAVQLELVNRQLPPADEDDEDVDHAERLSPELRDRIRMLARAEQLLSSLDADDFERWLSMEEGDDGDDRA